MKNYKQDEFCYCYAAANEECLALSYEEFRRNY